MPNISPSECAAKMINDGATTMPLQALSELMELLERRVRKTKQRTSISVRPASEANLHPLTPEGQRTAVAMTWLTRRIRVGSILALPDNVTSKEAIRAYVLANIEGSLIPPSTDLLDDPRLDGATVH